MNSDFSDLGTQKADFSDIGELQGDRVPHETLSRQALEFAKNLGLGTAAGVADPFVHLSNLINRAISAVPGAKTVIPQQLRGQITPPQWGAGVAGQIGRGVGQALPLFAAGPMGEGAEITGEATQLGRPLLESITKYLTTPAGRAISRTAGMAGYGALMSPEDRARGALMGAGLGTAGEIAAPIAGQLRGALGKLIPTRALAGTPADQAQTVLNTLGKGLTKQENVMSFANRIKDARSNAVAEGSDLYNNVLNQPGITGRLIKDNNIYQTSFGPLKRSYPKVGKDIFNKYDRDIKPYHQAFMENPTFENAHSLQSQLGYEIRDLTKKNAKGMLDLKDKSTMKDFKYARKAVTGDMSNFLNKQDPTGGLSDAYKGATQNWKENVAPYTENPKIAQIATGRIQSPGSIANLFSKPEPATEKIIDELGPDAKHEILFDELSKIRPNVTAERLQKAYEKLDPRRLDMYKTSSLDDQMSQLSKSMKEYTEKQRKAEISAAKKAALKQEAIRTAGMGAGLLGTAISPLAHMAPHGIPELVGALAGRYAAPAIGRGIGAAARGVGALGRGGLTPEYSRLLSRALQGSQLFGGQ